MCTKCLPTESTEQHKARHPGKASHTPDFNDPLYCFKGHKMLFQINKGEIAYVVGRLLQPFCSHALYRVRVLALHGVGNDCLCVHGTLIDFRESPVRSHAIEAKQLVRWEATDEQGRPTAKLSRDAIERIVRAQGVSVGFRKINGTMWVDTWKYLRTERNAEGKKRSITEKHRLGASSKVAEMSEKDLAAMVRAKFGIESKEEAEKVEVLQ